MLGALMRRSAITFDADFPDGNNVPCGFDVLGGVTPDKQQIGAEARRDVAAVG
jgi:hypothetical protein